jgi:hypothetical protein
MAYSDKQKTEIFDVICENIINGKSLRTILNQIEPKISPSTFFIWLREDESKSKQYDIATKERSELMFEEMFDIADDSSNDYMAKQYGDGIEVQVLNSENIQRSRLRIDTRKWALSKMNPKKYGEKTDITTNGKEINIPIIEWVKSNENSED